MEDSLYELVNVERNYGGEFSLRIPHLSIRKGTATGLMGLSGSGKSTLLQILAFLDSGYSGSVRFSGHPVSRNAHPSEKGVTILLQNPYLLKRTVFDNVSFPLRACGKRKNIHEEVFYVIRLVGLDPHIYARRRWNQLSGGEAQRVALAARLIMKPRVLILDEPTSNIDARSAQIIKSAVETVRKKTGMDIIVSSHDTIWLNSICREILHMHNGRIVATDLGNVLPGPWKPEKSGLWSLTLEDGQHIRALPPPAGNSIAIIDAKNIMLSMEKPHDISAQNILTGRIVRMSGERETSKVRVEIDISGFIFHCSITQYAAESLRILPGWYIWIIFKASSVEWS